MDNSFRLNCIYIDKLNSQVFAGIDFEKLGQSYQTDFVYAKEILQNMTELFKDVYGVDYLACNEEIEFVDVPAVIHGRNNDGMCIGLVNLDLESSGEHWGTCFITEEGIGNHNEKDAAFNELLKSKFVPYDYWYTIKIYGDIHVDMDNVPKEISELLNFDNEPTLEHEM